MRSPHEPLVIPRDAPVYAADGVKLGVVNSVGMQSLRVRQGRFLTRYLDVPVVLVGRVEHGGVWLTRGVNATLEASRPVASATAPDSPMRLQTTESLDAPEMDEGGVQIPYKAPVYTLGGARLGTTIDATRSALIVRVGAPWSYRIPLPLSTIDRIEDEQVWLNVSYDDAKRIGAGVMAPPPMTTAPRVVRTGEPTSTAAD